MEYSDFGPVERHYHVLPKPDIQPHMLSSKNVILGWQILAGAVGIAIFAFAIKEWIKYRDSKKDRKEYNF